MPSIPAELRYTDAHQWARREPDGRVTVGITDYAQEALGDVVFVDRAGEGGPSAFSWPSIAIPAAANPARATRRLVRCCMPLAARRRIRR